MNVQKECELLQACGFFKKHCTTNQLACQGFISMYCKGDKMDQCKRKLYRRQHGVPPTDDMLPSGQILNEKPSN